MMVMCSAKILRMTLAGLPAMPMDLRRLVFSSTPLPCSWDSSALQIWAGLMMATCSSYLSIHSSIFDLVVE